jgi:hypothetical protein
MGTAARVRCRAQRQRCVWQAGEHVLAEQRALGWPVPARPTSLLSLTDALFRGVTLQRVPAQPGVAPNALTVSATGPVTCIGVT